MNWKYATPEKRVVYRVLENGQIESCLATREDIVAWVAAGNIIEEEDNV
jgi:hypothetical protein